MLATIADPQRAPEMLAVRESIRGWRFYEGFRTDAASPVRIPQVGTFTPVLNNDGTDLAGGARNDPYDSATREALDRTIEDAFPGSRIEIEEQAGRFEVQLRQHGLLRPLSAAEFSDGTLRYLLWTAALLTPRPPELMVLNEPETSLHPDLLPALARLIVHASGAPKWSSCLIRSPHPGAGADRSAAALHLEKSFGETVLAGATLFNAPKWEWPRAAKSDASRSSRPTSAVYSQPWNETSSDRTYSGAAGAGAGVSRPHVADYAGCRRGSHAGGVGVSGAHGASWSQAAAHSDAGRPSACFLRAITSGPTKPLTLFGLLCIVLLVYCTFFRRLSERLPMPRLRFSRCFIWASP